MVIAVLRLDGNGGPLRRGGAPEHLALPRRVRLPPRLDQERGSEKVLVAAIPGRDPGRALEPVGPLGASRGSPERGLLENLGPERQNHEEEEENDEGRSRERMGPDRDREASRARAALPPIGRARPPGRGEPAGECRGEASECHDREAREVLRRERHERGARRDGARTHGPVGARGGLPDREHREDEDENGRRCPDGALRRENLDRLVVRLVRRAPPFDAPVLRGPVAREQDPERVETDAQQGVIVRHPQPGAPDLNPGLGRGRAEARDLAHALRQVGPHGRAREEEPRRGDREKRDADGGRDARGGTRPARERSRRGAPSRGEAQRGPSERSRQDPDPGASRERGGNHDDGDGRDEGPEDSLGRATRPDSQPGREWRRHGEIGAQHVRMAQRPEDPDVPLVGRRASPDQRVEPHELEQRIGAGEGAREARGPRVPCQRRRSAAGHRARGEIDDRRGARRDEPRRAVGSAVEALRGIRRRERRGRRGPDEENDAHAQRVARAPGAGTAPGAPERLPETRACDVPQLGRQSAPEEEEGAGGEDRALRNLEAVLRDAREDDRHEREQGEEHEFLERDRRGLGLHGYRRARHPVARWRRGVSMESFRGGFEIT